MSRCECSCGGARHAPGDQTGENSVTSDTSSNLSNSPSEVVGSLQEYNPELSESGKTVIKGAVIGGALATHPELAPLYKSYKGYNVSKKIYRSSDNPEELKKVFSKEGASRTAKSLSQRDASKVARDVKEAFNQAGGTENLFGDAGSGINDEVFATMLEGSVEGGIKSGAGEIAKYTVEGTM